MKHFLLFIGAVFIWPLSLFFRGLVIIISNLFLIIWYLNFKNLFWFKNYYFYVWRDAGYFDVVQDENGKFITKLVSYDEYYKTPVDMIRNKLTREYK